LKTTRIDETKPEEIFDHKTVKMSIDDAGMEHLMSNLTNLYSEPAAAILREYSANAIDSHVKSKQTRPVEIKIPTYESPYLVIQDYGVGMSEDDLENVYSKYGSSTKRDSNEQIGAFGLGAKSALAITDRFDLVTVKDGIKNTVYIQKNNRGVGVLHFVSKAPTKEPNGVKVTIPVTKNVPNFAKAAESAFLGWKPGSVLVNGSTKTSIYDKDYVIIQSGGQDSIWVKKGVAHATGYSYSTGLMFSNIRFVVGGIIYSVSSNSDFDTKYPELSAKGQLYYEVRRMLAGNNEVFLNLPIGSIDLTPSREALMMNDKTIKTIIEVLKEFISATPIFFESYIQGLPRKEAMKFLAEHWPLFGLVSRATTSNGWNSDSLQPDLNGHGVKWHGEEIPAKIKLESLEEDTVLYGTYAFKGASIDMKAEDKISQLFVLRASKGTVQHSAGYRYTGRNINTILVEGDTSDTGEIWLDIKKNVKDYARKMFDNENAYVVYSNKPLKNVWVSEALHVTSFDNLIATAREYRKEKRSEIQTGSTRSKASYISLPIDGITFDLQKTNVSDFDDDEIVYIEEDKTFAHYTNSWNTVWNVIKEGMKNVEWDEKESKISPLEATALYAVIPNKTLIFLTKGKTGETLKKRYPEARNLVDVVKDRLKEISKNKKESLLFTGLTSVYRDSFSQSIIKIMGDAGDISKLDDAYTKSVFSSYYSKDQMSSFVSIVEKVKPALMLDDKEVGDYKTLTNLWHTTDYYNFQRKYSLLAVNTSPYANNYNGHPDTKTKPYLDQLVLFINMTDKHYLGR
jgi:hypothetical protein